MESNGDQGGALRLFGKVILPPKTEEPNQETRKRFRDEDAVRVTNDADLKEDVVTVHHVDRLRGGSERPPDAAAKDVARRSADMAEGALAEELGSSSGSNDGSDDGAGPGKGGKENKGKHSSKLSSLLQGPFSKDQSEGKSDVLKSVGDTMQSKLASSKQPADKSVACPRCKSFDTKFCYYNNYNVNQPRHFCKGCQRYWTAGGTLRNVPVGAGRRKNKLGVPHMGGVEIPGARLSSSCSDGELARLPSTVSGDLLGSLTSERNSVERNPQVSLTDMSGLSRADSLGGPAEPKPFQFVDMGPDRKKLRRNSKGFEGGGRESKLEREGSQYLAAMLDSERPMSAENTPDLCTPGPAPEAGQSPTTDPARWLQASAEAARWMQQNLQAAGAHPQRWMNGLPPFGMWNGNWPFGFGVGWNGRSPGVPGSVDNAQAQAVAAAAAASAWAGGGALWPANWGGQMSHPPWRWPGAANMWAAAAAAAGPWQQGVANNGTGVTLGLGKHPRDEEEGGQKSSDCLREGVVLTPRALRSEDGLKMWQNGTSQILRSLSMARQPENGGEQEHNFVSCSNPVSVQKPHSVDEPK